MERHTTNKPTIRELQGRQGLRGLDGKVLDPRISDVLDGNDFALSERAAGSLKLSVVVQEGNGKDWVAYKELADQIRVGKEEADSSHPVCVLVMSRRASSAVRRNDPTRR